MNPWYKQPLEKFLSVSVILVLVLGLASCSQKAVSKEVSFSSRDRPQQISQQFTEVSPPAVIQALGANLEIYQPQVTIVAPKADEVVSANKVVVKLEVKDLPIFQHPQWQLGPHLHVIVDNQPYIPVYDVTKPLVLSDLAAGTHTLRVFASRPWHESFKNEGAYAQTTFHILTKTDDNNPDPTLPVLTYSRPQGNYGAEPILLDFYLTNAPLHLVAKDNPSNQFSDWRIRCTINGESFVFDRWQPVYLKGFTPGQNWVKLEFLDNQGNPVKNAFNTTVKLFNYQPKGKDTLSRIVRGELKADDVRGIVDPNYAAKPKAAEPTPTQAPTPEPKAVKPTPTQAPTPEPKAVKPTPTQAPTPQSSVTVTPTPEVTETRPAEAKVTPEPQVEITPEPNLTQPKKTNLGDYFSRRSRPTVTPSTSQSP